MELVDLLGIEIADGALDQRAFLVDEAGRGGFEGERADALPQALQVLEVALDLGLGARGAGGAQDDPLALRHFEVAHDVLETLAVGGVGDLARDAAATGGVGHQHGVAAGEREIGGEGSALVAALFLDDLHQHHLPALDHFLNLVGVAARRALAALAALFEHVGAAAERLDRLGVGRGLLDVAGLLCLIVGRDGRLRVGLGIGLGRRILGLLSGIVGGALGRRLETESGCSDFGGGALGLVLVVLLLGAHQRFAVGDGDLVVVGVDFAEGEEAVAIAAILDEGGLQRGLYARDLGEVDVAAQLAAALGFKIEFFELVTVSDDDPCFFRVGAIHQHSFGSHKSMLRAVAHQHSGPGEPGSSVWRHARPMG